VVKWQLSTCTSEVICFCFKENRYSKVEDLTEHKGMHLSVLLKNTGYLQLFIPSLPFFSAETDCSDGLNVWWYCRKKLNGTWKEKTHKDTIRYVSLVVLEDRTTH